MAMREYEAFITSFREKIGKALARNLVLHVKIMLTNGHIEEIYNPEVLGEAATTGNFIRGIKDRVYTEIFPASVSMVKFTTLNPERARELGVSPPNRAQAAAPVVPAAPATK